MRVTSVRVQRPTVDDATFARCGADLSAGDVLIVYSQDTGFLMDQFTLTQWERCAVIGPDGVVDFSFANDRLLSGRELDVVNR